MAVDGERRQLTVMFCDLVGSTHSSSQLDAEDWHAVVSRYHKCVTEVITDHGGHVAQYLGDGVLAYFGFPIALEDPAPRAARAALRTHEALAVLSERIEPRFGLRLNARVGIHSGLVVITPLGSGTAREVLAVGDTVNIAARLEGLAERGTVVISDATERMARGFVETEDLGLRSLAGVDVPMQVFRVLSATGARTRVDALRPTPLVARQSELERLLTGWTEARLQPLVALALQPIAQGAHEARLPPRRERPADPGPVLE